jgi:predicted nucleic acid-binding protein
LIYLDSAALTKLVRAERETAGLSTWLAEQLGQPRVASALIEVEVPRAVNRHPGTDPARLAQVLSAVLRIDVDGAVLGAAAELSPPEVRSLDAIHLATALELAAEVTAFVSYDKRLLDAARTAGLPVASPGA